MTPFRAWLAMGHKGPVKTEGFEDKHPARYGLYTNRQKAFTASFINKPQPVLIVEDTTANRKALGMEE